MPEHATFRPVWFHDHADFHHLRESFLAAGFTDRGVLTQLGLADLTRLRELGVDGILNRTADGSPLSNLIRLFLMGKTLTTDSARDALTTIDLSRVLASGLLTKCETGISTNFQVLPFLGLYFVVDKPRGLHAEGEPMAHDYVMGIGGSTQTLANITIRRPVGSMLDLGTGCGTHALLAARHADRVIAVDINPRAVALTRFNARLNGFDNVEARQGDMFDPVAGERFDLIVSNPPFVISPETKFIYRDSTLPDDGIVEHVVRNACPLLNDGGMLQMLCNWCHKHGTNTSDRLRSWLDDQHCDTWIHESAYTPADEYARTWLSNTDSGSRADGGRQLRSWLTYYHERGIEGMSIGMINARKRACGSTWTHMDSAPERFTMLGPAGDHVLRIFDNCTFLHEQSDEQLLQARLMAAPDARIMHELTPVQGQWTLTDCRIRLASGFAFYATLDAYMARLITSCDGTRPVASLLDALAADLDQEIDRVRVEGLKIIRALLERGFLLAPSAAADAAT
ncbi:MAG: methyltransferase [Phycisphaeraceae bacterium]|nr:methyltransferase [Phycisphaeraceae bacterium]MCW5753368.1 methyltransferase [Phycisphaeraceae bacterium]